ncbi:hypothetical protein AMECASPLE_025989 [Ameca splendens]|uniref:Uncharacterized protein n=1 Tax=Ameca splendens TaxID=208324 RepID=A0ABV0XTX0_9TELE
MKLVEDQKCRTSGDSMQLVGRVRDGASWRLTVSLPLRYKPHVKLYSGQNKNPVLWTIESIISLAAHRLDPRGKRHCRAGARGTDNAERCGHFDDAGRMRSVRGMVT